MRFGSGRDDRPTTRLHISGATFQRRSPTNPCPRFHRRRRGGCCRRGTVRLASVHPMDGWHAGRKRVQLRPSLLRRPLCVLRAANRTICEKGDSFTEPYVAGHNVLNAHARAVSTYRTKYKAEQRGMIGITLNCDWAVVRRRGAGNDHGEDVRGRGLFSSWQSLRCLRKFFDFRKATLEGRMTLCRESNAARESSARLCQGRRASVCCPRSSAKLVS